MSKVTYLSSLALCLLTVSASGMSIESTYVLTDRPNFFANLVRPNQGIRIVSSSEYYKTLPPDMKEKEEKDFKEFKKKGYIEESTTYPSELLNMIAYKMTASTSEYVPQSSDLHKSIKEIPLSFLNYEGIPFIAKNKIIGFSPVEVKLDSGWTGVSQFFINDFGGVCSFEVLDVGISGSSAIYNIEHITHEVNNKPTIVSVRGNKDDKFIYSVSWIHGNMDYNLSCANRSYGLSYTKRTIELARRIDSSLKITG